jgi:hypothetical protein
MGQKESLKDRKYKQTLGMHIPVSLSGSFFIFLISFVMMGYWLALSLVLT